MNWPAADVAAPVIVHDFIVGNISRAVPRSSNGTAEAGFWAGNRCIAQCYEIYNAAWTGQWTGAMCINSDFGEFKIICEGKNANGIYIEHDTKNTTFHDFMIRAHGNAINAEWWYGGSGSNNLTIQNFDIHSETGWGIFLDAGTYGCHISNGKLSGYAGIAHPNHLQDPTQPNFIDWASIETSDLYDQSRKEWKHDHVIGALLHSDMLRETYDMTQIIRHRSNPDAEYEYYNNALLLQ